jgi:hypothetical protein
VAAPALAEVRQHRLHAVEDRLHVRRDHVVEVLVGELRDRPRDPAARVGDPGVDLPEPLERPIPQQLVVRAPRDVRRHRERRLTEARRDRGELRLAPRGQHDAGAARDGHLGELLTDARRRSRDDDDLVLHGAINR